MLLGADSFPRLVSGWRRAWPNEKYLLVSEVDLFCLLLGQLPQTRVSGKPIRMPDHDQITVSLFGFGRLNMTPGWQPESWTIPHGLSALAEGITQRDVSSKTGKCRTRLALGPCAAEESGLRPDLELGLPPESDSAEVMKAKMLSP